MKIFRFFIFALLLSFCGSILTLTAAPRTLDEIEMEQQKKKEEAKKETKPTPESNQTPVTQTKTYNFAEKVIGILKPFKALAIDNYALLNADKRAVELFEKASKMENNPDSLQNPYEILGIWKKITEISDNNPFIETANNRIADWSITIQILKSHQDNLDKVTKIVETNAISDDQKTSLVIDHFYKFGKAFGIDEITSMLKGTSGNKILQNQSLKNKTGEIAKYRCTQNLEKDCFKYGDNFAQSDEEKESYFAKACDMQYSPACKAKQAIINRKKAEAAKIAQKREEEKKEEINNAGRKKRLAIATSTFVPGLAISILGGVSFYGMSQAEKKRQDYYRQYLTSTNTDDIAKYRKKADDADKKRKTYLALGAAGIGVGVALIATGITFYSIEFEGEKEVKKKYNVSFGASPIDGTLQFAFRW